MKNPYHYLFYRFYRIQKAFYKKHDPHFGALFLMSGFMFMNVISAIELIMGHEFVDAIFESKKGWSVLLICIALNWLLLVFNKKSETIVSHYENENKNSILKGKVIISCYIAFSIVFMIYTIFWDR